MLSTGGTMTAPMEFEEPEEVLVAGRYIEAKCVRCKVAPAVAIPEQVHNARCIECGRADAGVMHDSYVPTGPWHLTVRYGTFAVPMPSEVEAERCPDPEVCSPEGVPAGIEVPASVVSLAAYGEANGWRTRVAYARGYGPKKYHGQWQKEETFSIRFANGNRGAYAVYRTIASKSTWTWRSVWIWGEDLPPFGMCGVGDLKVYLARSAVTDGVALKKWCDHVHAFKIEAERVKATAAAGKPKKGKVREGAS